MKNVFVCIVLFLVSCIGFSQEKFSVELSHPISLNGYFNNNYENNSIFHLEEIDSYLDIGLGYKFFKIKNIDFLFHINMSYFKKMIYEDVLLPSNRHFIRTNYYLYQPKVKLVYSFPFNKRLKLNFGISYSYLVSSSKKVYDRVQLGSDFLFPDRQYYDINDGVGFNTGISYDLFHQLYIFSDYNFSKFYKSSSTYKSSLIKIGLGYRF